MSEERNERNRVSSVTVIGKTDVITEPNDLVHRENRRGPSIEP